MAKVKVDRDNLKEICDYLELSEKKHYAECGYPKNHIWRRVKQIKKEANL